MVLTCRSEFESSWGEQKHVTSLSLSRLDLEKGAQIVYNLTKGKYDTPHISDHGLR
jgi:hypothetical protein